MKRMLALLIALMLLTLPALAEPMSYLDYTDDLLEDGSPIYYFPELSLTLPADWSGKVMAMREEGGTSFYQKASYEKYQEEGLDGGGFLFALGASVNSSFSELPAFEYIGFSEESAMNYYLVLPTDYPAYMGDEAVRAEYDAMAAGIDFVVEHAMLYPRITGDAAGVAMESAGEVADTAGEAAAAHTLAEVRYYFEHNLLPRYFYEMPEDMLNAIRAQGLDALWTSFATENGVDPTYPAEDFAPRWYAAGGATLVQIELPKPEENTQCFRVYMVYDAASDAAGYYTVEYDNLLGETCFLCGWTAEGYHMNYGGTELLDKDSDGYEAALRAEAATVAGLAGLAGELTAE